MNLSLTVTEKVLGDTLVAYIYAGESYNFHDEILEKEGLYEVILSSQQGCDSLTYLDLRMNSGVYVPNVFSSNDRSPNNRFIIFSDVELVIRKYKIYDRWGNTLFASKNFKTTDGIEHFWDAYSDGRKVSKGVYVYSIEYLDQKEEVKHLHGTVTLL